MALDTQPWTLDMLHRLPEDGNKYELIRGELFVTPPPTGEHENVIGILHEILAPYVRDHRLGRVYRPHAVVRVDDSEAEPGLFVRAQGPRIGNDWQKAPLPILLVEVLSPSTRRRDFHQKRSFYMDVGIPEYWVVDPEERVVHVFAAGGEPRVESDVLRWRPTGTTEPLEIALPELFAEAGL
ncbi:MAG: Uma2 family endonuclease [Gemmatimonadaceae bacterium]